MLMFTHLGGFPHSCSAISVIWSTETCKTSECCKLNFRTIIITQSSFSLAISNPSMCSPHWLIVSPRASWCSSRDVWSFLHSCCNSLADLLLCLGQYLDSSCALEFLPNTASSLPQLVGAWFAHKEILLLCHGPLIFPKEFQHKQGVLLCTAHILASILCSWNGWRSAWSPSPTMGQGQAAGILPVRAKEGAFMGLG